MEPLPPELLTAPNNIVVEPENLIEKNLLSLQPNAPETVNNILEPIKTAT